MKRRKRKWPVILCLCVAAAGAFAIYPHFKLKKKEVQRVEPTFTTWSGFTQHKRLEMLVKGFAIDSIIDIPCTDLGDFPAHELVGIHYIGITPSKARARALQAQFGSESTTFLDREVTIDVLPKADLIFCWDLLCTLRQSEARAAIEQFKRSGAHFLLMRHFPEVKKNRKNKTGEMIPVNWTLPPYNFPDPLIHIMEKGEHGMESLALWNLEIL